MLITVFRPRRIKNGKTVISRTYRGRFRLDEDDVLHDVSLYTTDKRVAQQRLEEMVKKKQMEATGLIAPELAREAAVTPFTRLLKDYVRDLHALGRGDKYVYNLEKLIVRLFDECGWNTISDIRPAAFLKWRASQKKAPKTLNEYLNAALSFLNWLQRSERIESNPLQSITKVQTQGRQVLQRRAFTEDEMKRLPGIAGPRRVVYLAAVFTGLRRGELKQLLWDDIHLDSPQPYLIARASTTKNHKQAAIVLHPDLTQELQALKLLQKAKLSADPYALAALLPGFPLPPAYAGDQSRARWHRSTRRNGDNAPQRYSAHREYLHRHRAASHIGRRGEPSIPPIGSTEKRLTRRLTHFVPAGSEAVTACQEKREIRLFANY